MLISSDQELVRAVRRRRNPRAPPFSEDDVLRAISKLRSLGQGFRVLKLGGRPFVQSVPNDLKEDYSRVLELAAEAVAGSSGAGSGTGAVSEGRGLTAAEVAERARWPRHQAESALDELLKEGLCMVDDGDPSGQRLYWFPSLWAAAGAADVAPGPPAEGISQLSLSCGV
jgi:hypothetical protein